MGGARTALFNWLYARQTGGAFLLRIEDTDKARSTDESERAIFEGLEWLGLNWDEQVVHQALGLPRHQRDANFLLSTGTAYRCFCTAAELEVMRKEAAARKDSFKYDRRCDRLSPEEITRRVDAGTPFVVRFRMPDGETAWDDAVHERIAFPNKDIEDFVILRSDGTPIYNLAVVSDDIDMGITLVMRGDDHISNTPKQIQLYRALGNEPPRFAHVPMIHGMDGKKLSKRHGAAGVEEFQAQGVLPDALDNFLALLGWSPGDDKERMTLLEMVSLFSLERIGPSASRFDHEKLLWLNGQYLQEIPAARLVEMLKPFHLPNCDAVLLDRAIMLHRSRARTLVGLAHALAIYGDDPRVFEPAGLKKFGGPEAAPLLRALAERLSVTEPFSHSTLEESGRALAAEKGRKLGDLAQPARLALTGVLASPPLFEMIEVLGKETTRRRLLAFADLIAREPEAH